MSSPETLAPVVLSAQELLLHFNEDQLVQLLNDSRNESGGFDISRVVGVDDLSKDEREAFSKKLSAAAVKAGSLNINELSRRLDIFAGHDEIGGAPSRSQTRHDRSPTSSPVSEDHNGFEAFCHDELVKAGGRPVISFELLLSISKDAEVAPKSLEPWLNDKTSGSQDGDVPSVFSEQMEDWISFRHKWQWDNRGKIASEEGYSAFFDWRKKNCLQRGETKWASNPSFEETTRRVWQHEPRFWEQSGKDGFTAYARAVEKRLSSHKFTQSFQLAEDPRRQDAKTTWVEYLNYNYWWQDRHAAKMKSVEPRYRQAWDELENFHAVSSANTSTAIGTLDEQLNVMKTELQAARQQIGEFLKKTTSYRRAEAAFHRHELRAEWVLEQLPLIEETAPPPEHEAAEKGSSERSSKKEKSRSESDVPSPRQRKRQKKKEVDHSSSPIPDPPQFKAKNEAEPRRSQRRRRVDDVAPETLLSNPQAAVRKSPRKKGD